MIQQACTRKLRRGQDRCNDSRGRVLRDRPGLQGVPPTPSASLANRAPSPIALMAPWLPTYATSSMKMTKRLTGFSRRLVAPPRLRPTGTPLMRSSRCTRLLSATCLRPLKSVPRQVLPTRSLKTLTLPLMIKFSFFFSIYVYCGKRTGIVFMIFLSLYVFLSFLTWRARHSQLLFATRLCFPFCNQLASARLVIRRAVEIESLQLVSCSWSPGLVWFIIVTFHDAPFE